MPEHSKTCSSNFIGNFRIVFRQKHRIVLGQGTQDLFNEKDTV